MVGCFCLNKKIAGYTVALHAYIDNVWKSGCKAFLFVEPTYPNVANECEEKKMMSDAISFNVLALKCH